MSPCSCEAASSCPWPPTTWWCSWPTARSSTPSATPEYPTRVAQCKAATDALRGKSEGYPVEGGAKWGLCEWGGAASIAVALGPEPWPHRQPQGMVTAQAGTKHGAWEVPGARQGIS